MIVSTVGVGFTLNAFWPVGEYRRFYVPSFLFSWLTAELAAHHLAWQTLASMGFVAAGALEGWPGWIGLALSAGSWGGLVALLVQGSRARHTMDITLGEAAIAPPHHRIARSNLLVPFPFAAVRAHRHRDYVYRRVAGRELKLDVFMPDGPRRHRPAIVQIHGGAWVIGDKREQGIPLLVHLCQQGWVGFNVNYRLSPGATFPDPLVDLKYAIAWIREHAREFSIDPDFIAVTGGSAGGHLAAMVALTAGQPQYQPGFADADTSVQACVPLYGVYDLTNRLGVRSPRYVDGFIGPVLIKAFYDEEPEKFAAASPVDRVHADAPPFFVIHGDRDTMTPLMEAQMFVDRLRAVSRQPVLFASIAGAQHAFDVFHSPRSVPVLEGVAAFLQEQHARHQARRAEDLDRTAAEPAEARSAS